MSTAQMILLGLQIALALGNLAIMIYALSKFIAKPHDSLTERVTVLEVKMKEAESALRHGNDRFREQDATNEVLIHSVLALIEFEIQYCLTEHKVPSKELEKAKEDLHNYLARK